MDAQATLASKASLTLDLPPSCLQFCPSNPAYFVVGTYNLHQQDGRNASAGSPQDRDGSLMVLRIDSEQL